MTLSGHFFFPGVLEKVADLGQARYHVVIPSSNKVWDLQICKLMTEFGDFTHLDASLKHARKSEKARLSIPSGPFLPKMLQFIALTKIFPQK